MLGYSANNRTAVVLQSLQRGQFDVRLYGGLTRVLLAWFRIDLKLKLEFIVFFCCSFSLCLFHVDADMSDLDLFF